MLDIDTNEKFRTNKISHNKYKEEMNSILKETKET